MKMPFTLHQSFYFALGILIMKSVSLLMLPVVTHYLTPAQFGELELLLSVSNFATILVGFGLVDALYRFAGLSNTPDGEKKIGATIFTASLMTGGISFTVGLLVAPFVLPYLGETTTLFDVQLLVILFSVEGCIGIPLAWLKMKEKASSFFVLTTGKALIQALLSWQLLSAGHGMTAILLAGVISSMILVCLLLKIQIGETGLGFDFEILPKVMVYGTPLVISALASFALLGADRWVINMISTPEDLGLYAVGKKLAAVSVILMQPFLMWWYPRRFKQLRMDNGRKTVAHTTSLGMALVMCFATMICVGSPVLISTLLNENYAHAMNYVPAMALLYAIKQLAELANLGSYIGRTTLGVMTIDLITAAVSITLLYLLSPIYKVPGVIAALIIAQCFRAGLFYFKSQRALWLGYAKGKLSGLAVVCVGLVFAALQLTELLYQFLLALSGVAILAAYVYFSGLFSYKALTAESREKAAAEALALSEASSTK